MGTSLQTVTILQEPERLTVPLALLSGSVRWLPQATDSGSHERAAILLAMMFFDRLFSLLGTRAGPWSIFCHLCLNNLFCSGDWAFGFGGWWWWWKGLSALFGHLPQARNVLSWLWHLRSSHLLHYCLYNGAVSSQKRIRPPSLFSLVRARN